MLPSLKAKYLHELCGILLHCLISPIYLLICSIIYSYKHEPMDIYVTLWVIIQYYFIYVSAHIVPALNWETFQLVPMNLQNAPIDFLLLFLSCFVFFSTSLHSGITRWSKVIFYISCPSSISHFSKKSYFLYWRMAVETKTWELVATGYHFFYIYMCLYYINLLIYTYLYVFLHVTISTHIKLNMNSYFWIILSS